MQGLFSVMNDANDNIASLKKTTGFGSLRDLIDQQYQPMYDQNAKSSYQQYLDNLARSTNQIGQPNPLIDPKTGKELPKKDPKDGYYK